MADLIRYKSNVLLHSGLRFRKEFNMTDKGLCENLYVPLNKERQDHNWPFHTYGIIAACLVFLVLAVIGIVHVTSGFSGEEKKPEPPDPEVPLPSSPSFLRKFSKGAVCSDGAPCSEIGRDILLKNGSAVDAAIATLFCNGVVNCHSMGLGGGFMMTIYDRKDKNSYVLNAREMAPGAADEEMFRDDPSLATKGPLASCVPGELAGYWAAHQKFGRLPWADIVKPTLRICEHGYNMTQHQHGSLSLRSDIIHKDELLKKLFVDPSTGKFHPPGTRIVQREICETLKVIAEEGAETFYTGRLAEVFVNDVKEKGGIITLEDMKNYRVQWVEPVKMTLNNGLTLHSVPPPGSGTLLAFILNILDNYNFTNKSVSNEEATILTSHRVVESFKFAFARRSELGDPSFVNTSEIIRNLTDKSTGEWLRSKINDDSTFQDPGHYGAVYSSREDHGTAHVSVISPEGDAVSVTSTINLYFGAGFTSKRTGIILNSEMDDFSSKYFPNYFDLPVSKANRLEPGKRPFSSMCPSILIDPNGDVRLVVGAAGGPQITTGVAYVIIRHLWFGEDVKVAVDASRIHHQLFPNTLSYEYGILQQIVKGFQKMGHKTERMRSRSSVVCALAKLNDTIFANADYRKGGDVHGF